MVHSPFQKHPRIRIMKLTTLLLMAAMLTLATSGPGFAETLEEAWQIGLAADHIIKAAAQDTEASQANLAAAEGARLPSVHLGGGYRLLDNEPVSIAGIGQFTTADDASLSYQAMMQVPVFSNFQISSNIEAANEICAASKQTEQSVMQSIKLRIAEAYFTVLLQQQQVEVAVSHEQSLAAHANDVQNLHDEGMVPVNDLLAARVALANARQTTLQAQNGLDVARSAYNRLLGRPMDYGLQLVPPSLVFSEIDFDALSAKALANRSGLAALTNQINALLLQAKAAKSGNGPKIEVRGGYDYNENSHQLHEGAWQVLVGASWDIFDGNVARHKGAALHAQSRAVAENRQDLESLILLQVRQAGLDMDESRKRIAVAKETLSQADENLQVTRNRYQDGIGTNTEVLDAESMRMASYARYDTALHDAGLAVIRLRYAVGDL
ncbi:MAG: transporter [Deltaproteobacteria bacterium CG23_combo_of_CG06-09_8_20_14_all_60_8]|nr:MAG: transporter [Deltaproteobacteria bacterium CG23_combo_of_CG06-09_8_20_14_all_60_8]